MKDYWSKLPASIRGSKKKRFNYIMNIIIDGEEIKPPSQEPSEELAKYNISFSVKDSDGDGVGGASVTINDSSKTTGSAGGCSFQEIEEGEHTVSVTANGFEDYSDAITVNESNTSFDIVLTASG